MKSLNEETKSIVMLTNKEIKFIINYTDMISNSPSSFPNSDFKMIGELCDKMIAKRTRLEKLKRWWKKD